MTLEFQIISRGHEKAQLGESPCLDPESNDLWWVDITGQRLFKTDLSSGETRSWDTPEYPGFVVLTASGNPAIGMQSGIYAFTPDTGIFDVLVRLDQPGCRFNDATIDPFGRLWASTMALDASPGLAAIHQVNMAAGLVTFVSGLCIPNGLAVDYDRKRIFYSDSHPDIQSIWTQPVDQENGLEGEATLFATTRNLNGRPDGAALDLNGNYWIAGVDGGELYVFDHQGELHATLPVPFPAPTKMCFSGKDNPFIVVTSKGFRKHGGYLATALMPKAMTSGIPQPYWNTSPEPADGAGQSTREQ